MAARFSRRARYFDGSQGAVVEPAKDRVAEEEKQGTMIVPSDPSGRSSPGPAGMAVPHSGWARMSFSGLFQWLGMAREDTRENAGEYFRNSIALRHKFLYMPREGDQIKGK